VVVDALCRGLVNRDCMLVITLLGALIYGVLLGFVAPVIVLGTLSVTRSSGLEMAVSYGGSKRRREWRGCPCGCWSWRWDCRGLS